MGLESFLLDRLYETPISYDDETDKKVGKIDKKTGTKWFVPPPENATLEEIGEFVKKMEQDKVLVYADLGSGKSKSAKLNDGKTVCKWNHETENFGNQIKQEVEVYRKFSSKYPDVLPKFYKWGTNWVIQELVEPVVKSNFVEKPAFKSITGVDFKDFEKLADHFQYFRGRNIAANKRPNFDKFVKQVLEFLERADKREYANSVKLLNNSNIRDLLKFSYESKVSSSDFHDENIGISKDKKIKILDFGV